MDTKERQLKKQQEILGGYNKDEYATERFLFPQEMESKCLYPLFTKRNEKNGSNPLLLAMGMVLMAPVPMPILTGTYFSLLNRGFIYAIAHIRGGQEMGRKWYDDGKMLKKKNTFNDFIDCGEYLVKEKYTSKEHLYALGGSAGGLLMGAVVNMAPGSLARRDCRSSLRGCRHYDERPGYSIDNK